MINSFLIREKSCKIMYRQSGSVDDSFKPTYTLSDEIDYLFKSKVSQQIKKDIGEDIQVDGLFIINDTISPGDMILFDSYEYEIVPGGILSRTVAFSNEIDYYVVVVSRRREYNEESVSITSRVD